MTKAVTSYELNEKRFLDLLTLLIGETKTLQNRPPQLVPVEDNAGRHVLKALEPYTKEKGGVLKVERVAFAEGRGNILIEYPGTVENKTISFVGSHLDVVPADPTKWDRDPFKLVIEGDKLYGRGTTDCLGHVALLTDLFIQLATEKPALKHSICAVFIVSEENDDIPNIGVDELDRAGKINHLKNGPVYWVDSADMQPTIGTGGAQTWNLTAYGKNMHSAMPNRTVNSLELVNEALAEVQARFYKAFPAHPDEKKYNYDISSTMKPTLWKPIVGSFNTIPGEATIQGDIRLTPFYDMAKCREAIEGFVKDINEHITDLRSRGPFSKYSVPEEGVVGHVKITWNSLGDSGLACDIDSNGYKALGQATKEVLGELKPVSTCGTLPLVRELKDSGFDIQITGFGKEETYHADNEYASLNDFKKAVKILTRTIELLENTL
ncbi:hypothetical protein CYY_004797 [Polysphondylium violaceum]|uniref:Peptidase M20 dimerisation domain-containing protein n=1 Tax=Polysphondylium violaceum TaxID=133409 RepID=A0A8J4PWA7_9MYCE|nr:hypothetical protein CYY_004797 [Polysphondylium violaceum]